MTATQPDLGPIWLTGVLISAPIFAGYLWFRAGVADVFGLLTLGLCAFGLAMLWPIVVICAVLAAIGVALGSLVSALLRWWQS